MEKAAIGVDIGTTQTKAVGFNRSGKVLTTAYVSYPLLQTAPGMAEQEIEVLFQAVVTCIRQVAGGLSNYEIELVSFACAMHSLLLMDENNQPLTRVLTWADNRAASYAQALKNTSKGQHLYQATGVPMHPMAPFHKLNWLKKEQPALYERAVKFIGVKEYLFFRFFGEYRTDYSSASGTGYFNIHNFTWDEFALAELNIAPTQLPKLAPPTFRYTQINLEWTQKLGLPATVSFILGGADGPLSNLGLGAIDVDTATLTVGTSGAVRYIASQPYLHPSAETFCYVLDRRHWVIGGATSNGAGIFDWACQNFLKKEQTQAIKAGENPYTAVLSKVAQVAPGAQGLLFQPYLLGERAPLWEAQASGSFLGLSRIHNEATMVRSVIEGICFNIKRILQGLEELNGPIDEIYASGGVSSSPVFAQIMADVLGKTLVFTESTEASALGAVLLGWQALNSVESLTQAVRKITIKGCTMPINKNSVVYQQMYPLFISTQQQLATSYYQLATLKEWLDRTTL